MRNIVYKLLFSISILFSSPQSFGNSSPEALKNVKSPASLPSKGRQEEEKKGETQQAGLGHWGRFNKKIQEKNQPPQGKNFSSKGASFEKNHPSKTKSVREKPTIINPHKAHYTISLKKKYSDDVSDVAGEMTIIVFNTGDGYVFEQNSSFIIYNEDGEGEQVVTNLATWQDYDGNNYRFQSRTLVNGEQEEIIKGNAVRDRANNRTLVTYQRPSKDIIQLPGDTVFPLHHLILCLQEARKGKGAVTHTVFDGSSETYEAVTVDTLLGAPIDSHLIIHTNNPALDAAARKQWPMKLSVFSLGSTNMEPDYEMIQEVLDSGVFKKMILDYGKFQVEASLSKLLFYQSEGSETIGQTQEEAPPVSYDS